MQARLATILAAAMLFPASAKAQTRVGYPPVPDPEQPSVTTQPADGGRLWTFARPMVSRLAPGEPIRIVLHWAGIDQYDQPVHLCSLPDRERHGIELPRTMASVSYTIRGPDGGRVTVRREPPSHPEPFAEIFYRVATQEVIPNGPKDPWQHRQASGEWKAGPPPDFGRPGQYHIQVRGTLYHGRMGDKNRIGAVRETRFSTDWVGVVIDPAVQPLRTIRINAKKLLRKQWPKERFTEIGGKRGMVRDDRDDNRIVPFMTRSKASRYDYDLCHVTVTPTGVVVGISKATVRTGDTAEGRRRNWDPWLDDNWFVFFLRRTSRKLQFDDVLDVVSWGQADRRIKLGVVVEQTRVTTGGEIVLRLFIKNTGVWDIKLPDSAAPFFRVLITPKGEQPVPRQPFNDAWMKQLAEDPVTVRKGSARQMGTLSFKVGGEKGLSFRDGRTELSQAQRRPPLDALPPGKYSLTVTRSYGLEGFWTGSLKSADVEIEITP